MKNKLSSVFWKSRARLTPDGKATLPPENFFFDPSKVLTGGVIFILPCLLLILHLADAFAKEFDAV